MAFKNFDSNIPIDGSMGLMYRLNILWNKADLTSMSGKFEDWNYVLDRIFVNLMYKEPLVTIKDEQETIIDVQLSPEDKKMYRLLNKKVNQANLLVQQADTKQLRDSAMKRKYQALLMKDAGLRKLQHKLKLYTKEHTGSPGGAMWGK